MAKKRRVKLTARQKRQIRGNLTAKQKKQIEKKAVQIVKKKANKCHAKTKSSKSFKKCMNK